MKKKIISWLAISILTLLVGLLCGPSRLARADSGDVQFKTDFYLELKGQQSPADEIEVSLPTTNTAGLSYQTMLDEYTKEKGMSPYKAISTLIGYANGTMSKADGIAVEKSITPSLNDEEAFQSLTYDVNNNLPFPDSSINLPRTSEEAKTVIIPTLDDGSNSNYTVNPPFIIYMVANDSQTTIKYSVPDGVTAPESKVVRGYGGEEPVNIDSPAVPGYVPDKQTVTVNFATGQENTITVHYAKPGTTGTSTSSPAAASSSSSAASTTSSTVTTTTPQKLPNQTPIYALKKLYLYQHPTFKKQQRLATYPQTKRAARPMFVVLGTAYSKNGLLRYHVKDVNHQSKTAGKTGYVTTDSRFVASVYYQKSTKQVKVLAPAGISEYRNVNLTRKVKTLKTHKTVKVVGLKHYHQTTRFVLSNGHYITANKKLVIAVK
ncbi:MULTISPECIES: DUF5776 domain-containing protein [Levilactobacillus]|uniref:DUF5776 domain-containing protein n=1 Tax=Levilactobacillus TaxID=2767886 RepID=UPI003757E5E1